MTTMDTINRMLGEHEAAIRNMETNHKRCGEMVNNKVNAIDTEQKTICLDIKGIQDQVSGSIGSISNLDMQVTEHERAIAKIEMERMQKWATHDSQCDKCRESMKVQTKEALTEYFGKIENMGVICLCRKYWYWVAAGFILFMMLFQFRPESLHFFFHDVLHIGTGK